jgi:hypothetical protein
MGAEGLSEFMLSHSERLKPYRDVEPSDFPEYVCGVTEG